MRLSILICSLESRKDKLASLIKSLLVQIPTAELTTIEGGNVSGDGPWLLTTYRTDDIEILICTDNRTLKVGEKRNMLIANATGEYTCFIDDDDEVTDDYVPQIMAAMDGSDCIVFQVMRYENGSKDKPAIYGLEFRTDYGNNKAYFRLPNHLMPIKRSITSRIAFDAVNFGEDSAWAKKVRPHLTSQSRIYDTLYNYMFSTSGTETQKSIYE